MNGFFLIAGLFVIALLISDLAEGLFKYLKSRDRNELKKIKLEFERVNPKEYSRFKQKEQSTYSSK